MHQMPDPDVNSQNESIQAEGEVIAYRVPDLD